MKRQQAFLKEGKFLKGMLHCHSTRSDGKLSPAEVLRAYREKGYDFISLTDHKIYNFENFAPETGITLIPGMEYDNTLEVGNGKRYLHTVCLGPEKEQGNGFSQDERLTGAALETPAPYQSFLDEAHEKKNLTFFCHPQWSSTSAKHILAQKGNFAMEICNYSSTVGNDMDSDAAFWDEVLGAGVPIYGVAVDDSHSLKDLGGAWVMVNGENSVDGILSALEKGEFYSSTGPEIYDFYVEGNRVVVKCSPCAKIRLHSDKHPNKIRRQGETPLTEGEFEMKEGVMAYSFVRVSVVDEQGRIAWTNPIFLD